MLISEFIDRTGYIPAADEYAEIEKAYYVFKGDKDAFCRAWSKANQHKAGTLWAKQAEQARKSKVYDRLYKHLCRCKFDPNWLYDYNYVERQEHIDAIMGMCKAKDRSELKETLKAVSRTYGVASSWPCERIQYLYELIKFA